MQAWLRRGVAGALLLCLIGFLIAFNRLDDKAIGREVIAQLQQASGMDVHAQRIRLSMQHGLSLKVSHLAIGGKAGGWGLDADIASFDIAYTSLLFGKVRISSIDLVHPVLRLQHSISPDRLFGPVLVAGVLRDAGGLSLRQGTIMMRNRLFADQVEGSLRSVMNGEQTNWEVQCRYAGGDFTSQGYFRNDHTGREKVFGRISATQLQLSKMPGLSMPPLHYDMLDASLTFSLDANGQWLWFGNMLSHDRHGELPDLSWRGKIGGKSLHDFSLQDAFMNFGKSTRVVLDGGCESGHVCQFGINTSKADAGLLFRAIFGDTRLSGSLDARLTALQEGAGWRIDGELGLRHAQWARIRLPDSVTDISGGHIDSLRKMGIEHADIRPDGEMGALAVSHLQFDSGRLGMELLFDRLRDAWVPLGNLWLAQAPRSFGFGTNDTIPTLSGSGELDGSVRWRRDTSGSQLQFALEADKAQLGFGKLLAKPEGLKASAQGSFTQGEAGKRLMLTGLQLGDSRLSNLDVVQNGKRAQLSFAGLNLDLDALKKAGLALPADLGEWHGSLAGGLVHMAPLAADLRQALAKTEGKLSLDGFGYGGQAWSGVMRLHDGQVQAPDMHWQQGDSFAEFSAAADVAGLRGRLDIRRASLSWTSAGGLPSWMRQAGLHGRFARTNLQWDGNAWKQMRGDFAMRDGGLSLEHIEGRLAGGGIHSRRMRIENVPGGLHVAGQLGMTAVRLDRLQGLADALGVKPAGYLFFNARLAGTLPAGINGVQDAKYAKWGGNGDVEIHRGSFAKPSPGNEVRWRNTAASELAGNVAGGFDGLAARFRIRNGALHLSRLHLSKGGLTLSGDATVAADGAVTGKLAVRRGEQGSATILDGSWPAWAALFPAP